MYASVDVRCDKFAKPVVGMLRAPKSCADSGKSLKMPVSWLPWCDNAKLLGERYSIVTGKYSCSDWRSSR